MDSPKSADEEFDDSISDRSYWIRQGGDWIWARDSSENRTQLEKDVTTHPIWSPTRLADLINHILYPRAQPSNHSETQETPLALYKASRIVDPALVKYLSLLIFHWFCREPEEYKNIIPLSLMNPTELTAINHVFPIDQMIKLRYSRLRKTAARDKLTMYTEGATTTRHDPDHDELVETTYYKATFDWDNIDNQIALTDATHAAEVQYDKCYSMALKRVVAESTLTMEQFRTACSLSPEYVTSYSEPAVADRFFRQILDQPAVRASLRYALLQHLPGSPPVGIAAVMHGYDFGEINLAAEYTFLDLHTEIDIRPHQAAQQAVALFPPLQQCSAPHRAEYVRLFTPMVDILLNSMYLAELKRTAPLMPEHLSYESTSKHIATPEKQQLQQHRNRVTSVIDRLRNNYHVASLAGIDVDRWLELPPEQALPLLPHLNPACLLETWCFSDSQGNTFLRDPPDTGDGPAPLQAWNLLEEIVSKSQTQKERYKISDAITYFNSQRSPIYSAYRTRSRSEHVHASTERSNAGIPVKAPVLEKTLSFSPSMFFMPPMPSKTAASSPVLDNQEIVLDIASHPKLDKDDTGRHESAANNISSPPFITVAEIMQGLTYTTDSDGRFPPATEQFFMHRLAVMDRNYTDWAIIETELNNDNRLPLITRFTNARLQLVSKFCRDNSCPWCPMLPTDLPIFIRFQLRGRFFLKYEQARRRGQPEPRGSKSWLTFPLPSAWF